VEVSFAPVLWGSTGTCLIFRRPVVVTSLQQQQQLSLSEHPWLTAITINSETQKPFIYSKNLWLSLV